jgi:hypothetical protein
MSPLGISGGENVGGITVSHQRGPWARWGAAHYRAGHDELTTGSVLLAMALRLDVWGVEASGRG